MNKKPSRRTAKAPKKASKRPASRRSMLAASDENQFYRLYNFIFTKPQADAEALILKLQKAVQGEEPTELIEKMEESSDALDKALAELNCPVSLSPQQRQVLVTVLLHPYFQKVRPWNAASSTW